ncbi:MAG: hypothetical protein P8N43_04135 [Alphaproteobacteria bacterium]|nr:hypothetical protein [Alphaproteobacteria bacterium]
MTLVNFCHLADGTAAQRDGPRVQAVAAPDGHVGELVWTPRRSDAGAAQSQVI